MRPPRILITGAGGQIGFALARELAPVAEVIAVDRQQLDLADPDAIVETMRAHAPDIVVNTAAYTAVDQAEREPALAHAVNALAPGVFAEEAKRCGALLIHYSTDYVFDGRKTSPYTETDATAPCNVYGQSKLDGEHAIAASGAAVIVLRTSWVYGMRGRNFLLTIQRLARERDELRIVDDQRGTPNWSRAMARATAAMIAAGATSLRERAGIYNLTCTGATTWFGFAQLIVEHMRHDVAKSGNNLPRVVPINTAEYPTPAARPANSVLDGDKFARTFGIAMPEWRQALDACLSGGGDSDA